MATKKFCDGCGKEMKDDFRVHHVRVREPVALFVEYDTNDPNRGDICKYCIIDAFKKLDDRAMEMPKYGVPREPTGAVVARGVVAFTERKSTTPLDILIGHVWRTMFDEAARMLPADPLPRGSQLMPGWQAVPLEPDDKVFEDACRAVMCSSSTLVGPGTARQLWREILLAVRQ